MNKRSACGGPAGDVGVPLRASRRQVHGCLVCVAAGRVGDSGCGLLELLSIQGRPQYRVFANSSQMHPGRADRAAADHQVWDAICRPANPPSPTRVLTRVPLRDVKARRGGWTLCCKRHARLGGRARHARLLGNSGCSGDGLSAQVCAVGSRHQREIIEVDASVVIEIPRVPCASAALVVVLCQSCEVVESTVPERVVSPYSVYFSSTVLAG
jgi:hypothetical protein